jgi:Zn/Cd-binding protein ZinT
MNALKSSVIIAMMALMLVTTSVMADDEVGNFTVDDASNFFHAMQKTDFGDIEISGNNITFYSPDGSVKCKGMYDYVGSKTVDFQGYPVEWHMFNLRSDQNGCSEYKHVIATAVHDEAGLSHWHMRYGKLCFDILMENPGYEMWYPTMAAEGTNTETVANAYAAEAEMIGAFVVATQEAASNSVTMDKWNGRWVNTERLLDDPLMNPIYEAASSAANALSEESGSA